MRADEKGKPKTKKPPKRSGKARRKQQIPVQFDPDIIDEGIL